MLIYTFIACFLNKVFRHFSYRQHSIRATLCAITLRVKFRTLSAIQSHIVVVCDEFRTDPRAITGVKRC
jgi:hypothetical protein